MPRRCHGAEYVIPCTLHRVQWSLEDHQILCRACSAGRTAGLSPTPERRSAQDVAQRLSTSPVSNMQDASMLPPLTTFVRAERHVWAAEWLEQPRSKTHDPLARNEETRNVRALRARREHQTALAAHESSPRMRAHTPRPTRGVIVPGGRSFSADTQASRLPGRVPPPARSCRCSSRCSKTTCQTPDVRPMPCSDRLGTQVGV
jgi:hypothetical protein